MRVPKTVKNGVYSFFRWFEDGKPRLPVGPAGAPVICHQQGGRICPSNKPQTQTGKRKTKTVLHSSGTRLCATAH